MMRAMPYKLEEGKGVVYVSEAPPKWKSINKFEQLVDFGAEINRNNNNNNNIGCKIGKKKSIRRTSSAESEPTSALDSIRRSPSTPTSTSTLSSSFAGVADPTCGGGGGGDGGGGGGGGIGLEEWDSLFPNGDGALLPWIMGDPDDPGLGSGMKHLLQSGNPSSVVVEYEGNAGLGVVDQVNASSSCAVDSLSSGSAPHPLMSPLSFEGKGKISSGCDGGGGGGSSILPNCGPTNVFNLNPNQLFGGGGGGGGSIPVSMQFPTPFNVVGSEKPQIFNSQFVMNQQQAHSFGNPNFMMSPAALGNYCQQLEHFQPQPKRHNPGVVLDPNLLHGGKNPFHDPGHHHELLLRKQQQQTQLPMGLGPHLGPHHLQQKPMIMPEQGVKDQLFKAADLIQTGNFSLAQEILARLNQQLLFPTKPPLIRAALYVTEALQMLLQLSNPVTAPPPKTLTPYDVVHKMDAYKVFSEVSPITQFVNFTCTQAILEALDDADAIHVIDFDIGCGAQWASLIQELPLRKRGAPSLHITAIAPPTTHSFELALVRENLVQFANDTGIAFELQVVNLDSFDPSLSSFPNIRSSEDECIAISIPIWASSTRPSLLPSILRFIKQCSPKIVVSLDKGFDRCDVPFPQHVIHSLESCTNFMESLDGLNVAPEIVNEVEKFFVQPRIENSMLGRLQAPDKMPHWKNMFASAGLVPLQFSNFTETQADYVVKRTPGRGFHVEKRQASLVLSWQRRELVAASAWRFS
ncbi:hypothetical protein RND81_06G230000 [Saponaria officinalis]|uniref:Uncharacterized protein n=1 Tax=Saponaria officinalis TaxID=3572 RepID=A0AAW1KEZ7_SAPOF